MSSSPGFGFLQQEVVSDEQLLGEYAAKGVLGAQSFEILFERYFNRLHAYLMFKGASPELAEDLAQEVFLRVVVAASTFNQTRGSFRAWLFTIATNIFTDHLRGNGDRYTVPLENYEAVLSYIPSQILHVDKILRGMTPDLREPLELSVLCGLTAPEIAQVLGLHTGTVYSRIYRARKELRRRLNRGAKIKRIPKKVFPSLPNPELEPTNEIQISMPHQEDYHND